MSVARVSRERLLPTLGRCCECCLGQLARRRGGLRCATGRNSRNNFADDWPLLGDFRPEGPISSIERGSSCALHNGTSVARGSTVSGALWGVRTA